MLNDRKYRGLGYDISNATSLKEMLRSGRLDWKVSEMPIESRMQSNKFVKHSGWKALVRPDATSVSGFRTLDITSSGYQVTQNEEIMQVFFDIAKLGEMKLETAGYINGGERVFAIAKIGGEFFFPGVSDKARIDHGEGSVEKDDRTYLKILMGAAHIHGLANTIDVMAERQICTNGLRISEGVGRWRFIHKRQFSDADRDEIYVFIGKAQEAFESYHEKAKRLRETGFHKDISEMFIVELQQPALLKEAIETVKEKSKKLSENSPEFGHRLIEHVLSKGQKYLKKGEYSLPVRQMIAAVENQPGADLAPNTAWNTYNAVTYYIDHMKGRTNDTGLLNAFYGEGAKKKVEALHLAVNYADRLAIK